MDDTPGAPVRHGPAAWEGPPRRHGPVARVAVLSDVHANVTALESVLAEPDVRAADLLVFCGDITWGPEPERTHALIAALGDRALAVRGNGDRFAAEIAAGVREPGSPRERWIPARHSAAATRFVAGLPFSLLVEIETLGPVLFCHGSPRSDNELVTPATPADRFAALAASAPAGARTIVTGHTHLQFDRAVAGLRSVNPGSVGLPFHRGMPGTAYWALLGPDVSLRSTRYDVSAALARTRATGDPAADRIAELLLRPPSPEEIITDAESRVFAD
ncbi:metallophosphoesterase family protein [Streptacidiphilus rugosus]|uniref:metallophosphoesterase family protein n=1 Tax=Streptacidiphilus rugosus TaxID=405783 RepID=UPI0012FC3150|nr:metallophosphoesterase family protein [Streptacidiphilus rugosus]